MTSNRRATIVGLALLLGLVGYMRWQGRIWWCACGRPTPVSVNVQSPHTSQHLFDAYSFSHALHGVLFFGVFWLLRHRWSPAWRLVAAIAIEVAWEMLENSPFVIERYRKTTVSWGYEGDSILNSLADVVSLVAGYYLARWLGLWKSVAAFVLIDLAMLWAIRDNLALNVLMLLWPIDAIRKWQAGA